MFNKRSHFVLHINNYSTSKEIHRKEHKVWPYKRHWNSVQVVLSDITFQVTSKTSTHLNSITTAVWGPALSTTVILTLRWQSWAGRHGLAVLLSSIFSKSLHLPGFRSITAAIMDAATLQFSRAKPATFMRPMTSSVLSWQTHLVYLTSMFCFATASHLNEQRSPLTCKKTPDIQYI